MPACIIPTNNVGGSPFLHILSSNCFTCLVKFAIITSVRWYLSVVLIRISLMANDLEHFFMGLLALVCLFWQCVCSYSLTIT